MELMLTPTDKLKKLIQTIAEGIVLVSNVSDGFQLQEITQLIVLVRDAKLVMADVPGLALQYRQLDDEARQALYAYITANVKFPKDANVELIIEKIMEVAVRLSELIQLFFPA